MKRPSAAFHSIGKEVAALQLISRIIGRVRIIGAVGLVAIVALASTRVGVAIVAKAAGIPSNAQGIGGFVNGARALVDPALVMVAAVAPLALIAGGLVLMFGGRRGMQIIGTSLAVLLVLGSVTALIN